MGVVAVHAGVAIGTLLLQYGLDVGPEESLVQRRCGGGVRPCCGGVGVARRRQVEGVRDLGVFGGGVQLVRQFQRSLAAATGGALHSA